MPKPLLILLTLFLSINATLAQSETLSVAADEWYPVSGDPADGREGYMIDLLRLIFEKQGINVDYRLMSWDKALEQVNGGYVDCVVGALKSEAPALLYPSVSWGKDQSALYVRKRDAWDYSGDLESLSQRSVGVILDYGYGEQLDAFFHEHAGHSVHFASGKVPLVDNINDTLSGKLDTLVETKIVMQATLHLLGLKPAFRWVADIGPAAELYVGCHNSKKRWIAMIDSAMTDLLSSGQVDRLLESYDVETWSH